MTVALIASAMLAFTGASAQDGAAAPAANNPPSGSGDFWTRDKMLGDLFGVRTNLANHGITVGLRLSQYWQEVGSGGVDESGEYGGTMDYIVDIDGDKLAGLKGFHINMHARTRYGDDIGSAVGSFGFPNAGMLMPLPGNYDGTDITGLTATQMFPFFGKLGLVNFGKLDMVDTLSGLFPWIALGQDGFMNVNGMFPLLPMVGPVQGLSLFGGSAIAVNLDYRMPQSGILVTGTKNVSTSWDFGDSFDDGVFMTGFHRFFWGGGEENLGYFTLMAYGSTKDQASNDRKDFVFIPGQGIASTARKEPWGVAGFLYQEFWRAADDPNRKANVTLGAAAGSDNPQFAQWSFFGSVEAHGPLAQRPADRAGVSGWYTGLSDNFTDLVSPLIGLRDTWGCELYYKLAINPWLHVSPDLQLIHNERSGDDLAVVYGLRVVADF